MAIEIQVRKMMIKRKIQQRSEMILVNEDRGEEVEANPAGKDPGVQCCSKGITTMLAVLIPIIPAVSLMSGILPTDAPRIVDDLELDPLYHPGGDPDLHMQGGVPLRGGMIRVVAVLGEDPGTPRTGRDLGVDRAVIAADPRIATGIPRCCGPRKASWTIWR